MTGLFLTTVFINFLLFVGWEINKPHHMSRFEPNKDYGRRLVSINKALEKCRKRVKIYKTLALSCLVVNTFIVGIFISDLLEYISGKE